MSYPYASTLQGLKDAIIQLRSFFPPRLTADTLKTWSIASNNEGTVLNVLRFLGIIDENGNKEDKANAVFSEHDDDKFAEKFSQLVEAAYKDIFDNWGETAWSLDRGQLISFFRASDHSSARVGKQQAMTFETLANIAGHGTTPSSKIQSPSKKKRTRGKKTTASRTAKANSSVTNESASRVSGHTAHFTVRIEINLPIAEDQQVYDRIFKSIKDNLYP